MTVSDIYLVCVGSPANDVTEGLPFPAFFSRVNPTLQVPLQSLALSTVFVIIFGFVYLGSSSALNAILGSSVILLNCR